MDKGIVLISDELVIYLDDIILAIIDSGVDIHEKHHDDQHNRYVLKCSSEYFDEEKYGPDHAYKFIVMNGKGENRFEIANIMA
jgi:hypothetical protein